MTRSLKQNPLRFALFILIALSFAASASAAPDKWVSVRTKNFFLFGNAAEKDVRAAAEKLEQFREAFKLLFPEVRFDATIPTNVVVFRDKASYRPFKPKKDDGTPDEDLAGFFQPGEDVNYITFSVDRPEAETFGIVFHEYVHFLVDAQFGKSQVPAWFNEGLAEYYQTIEILEGRKIVLGKPQNDHLRLLRSAELIPLEQFFSVDNYSLQRHDSESRGYFYAQAWALMHYLMEGGQEAKLGDFLSFLFEEVAPEKAFRQAFGMGYTEMEAALDKYVDQRTYKYRTLSLNRQLEFDTGMEVALLSEADTNAYLGDLLYHTHEFADAAVFLEKAVAADPGHTLANTSLGLVLLKGGRFDEAKKYLEAAVVSNKRNHVAQYSYAYLLSRESMDEFGYVSAIPPDPAAKMRTALKAAIDAAPNFGPSYQLMAFINLVNDEDLQAALEYIEKGLKVSPGNPESEILKAKILLRLEKYSEAEKIANRVVRTASAEDLRAEARRILNAVAAFRENLERIRRDAAAETGSQGEPLLLKRSEITEEDVERVNLENRINRLHLELPRLGTSEVMKMGRVESISCSGGKPRFRINAGDEVIDLVSKDFAGLYLLTLDEKIGGVKVGCDADLSAIKTVFTYRPSTDGSAGTLLSMTFVPDFFRLKTSEEIAATRPVVIIDDERTSSGGVDFDEMRRISMMEALRRSLRKPEAGERRVLGKLMKIECGRSFTTYVVSVDGRTMRLRNDPDVSLHIITYTPDAEGIEFRCGFGPLDVPALVTLRGTDDKKLDGNIVAIEFVPPSFTLD
ncbi:MAG: tetratricopeptide repeat protein [Acidobacteriota bacterium]|nr:MAG: tetratricopeptide repeat protein [Acidobacteriota bacterium]